MARASAWGMGNVFAYRALGFEEQAELLCLYLAHRQTEGEEVKSVLIGTAGDALAIWVQAREAAKGGGTAPPPSASTQRRPGPAQKGVTHDPISDIVKSIPTAQLLSG